MKANSQSILWFVIVVLFFVLLFIFLSSGSGDSNTSSASQDSPEPEVVQSNTTTTNLGTDHRTNQDVLQRAFAQVQEIEKLETPPAPPETERTKKPQTIRLHKIVSDENRTIGCPELEHLSGMLDLLAKGQASDSGTYASNSGCIYFDTTHLIAMTGEYTYEHEYKDSIIPLTQAEVYVDEYVGTYWVMKNYFDHPEYTVSVEKETEQQDWTRSANKLSAAMEAEPLEQAKADAEQREHEAAIAAHKAKFSEWEFESDQELGDLIYVYNMTSESQYDTYFRLIYTCNGRLVLSGDGELSTQRTPMRFDNSELNRRWRELSWEPGAIQIQRVPNPALQGNRLSIKLTYKLTFLLQEENITDVVVFPISLWKNAVGEYCNIEGARD